MEKVKRTTNDNYTEIVLTTGEIFPRDKSFENCPMCGVSKGDYHIAYCNREVCPLCNQYISECDHLEGYEMDASTKSVIDECLSELSA